MVTEKERGEPVGQFPICKQSIYSKNNMLSWMNSYFQEISTKQPNLWSKAAVYHFRWKLPVKLAMELYDQCPQACVFETENEDLWHVDVYVQDPDEVETSLLQRYSDYTIDNLGQQDWVSLSQLALPPITIGNICIHTHHYPPSSDHAINLCIDATQAFGSGHHETTQGCLHLIQKLWSSSGWTNALDVGCGSGVLTMAMNFLCPGSATGFDCDPAAVAIAQDNARLNLCPTNFFVAHHIPPHIHADCVVANIVDTVLISMASSIPSSACHIILSGMLRHQADAVKEAYALWGWKEHDMWSIGDWVSLWLCRQIADNPVKP